MREPRFEAVCRAASIVGSPERLQVLLGVPMCDLGDWLARRGSPPIDAFLKAVDIIDENGAIDVQPALRLIRTTRLT